MMGSLMKRQRARVKEGARGMLSAFQGPTSGSAMFIRYTGFIKGQFWQRRACDTRQLEHFSYNAKKQFDSQNALKKVLSNLAMDCQVSSQV